MYALFICWTEQKVISPPTDSKLIRGNGNAQNRGMQVDGLPLYLNTFAHTLHVRKARLLIFSQESCFVY